MFLIANTFAICFNKDYLLTYLPIECDLGYRFRIRTLNPDTNLNPNPKTDPNPNPNPKSKNNLCSAKRHPNKVQDSVINTSYFVRQGVGCRRPITAKRVPVRPLTI